MRFLIAVTLLLPACDESVAPEPFEVSPAYSIANTEPDASATWPGYGFDPDNSQFNAAERELSVDRIAGLSERWRIKIPAGATSTPAIWNDTIYFGGWDGHVYAADADTGELRWQQQVTKMLVRSTPLLTEDRVYVAAGPNLVALERQTGSVVFESLLDPTPEAMIDSSPKLVDGMIVIGTFQCAQECGFGSSFGLPFGF